METRLLLLLLMFAFDEERRKAEFVFLALLLLLLRIPGIPKPSSSTKEGASSMAEMGRIANEVELKEFAVDNDLLPVMVLLLCVRRLLDFVDVVEVLVLLLVLFELLVLLLLLLFAQVLQ